MMTYLKVDAELTAAIVNQMSKILQCKKYIQSGTSSIRYSLEVSIILSHASRYLFEAQTCLITAYKCTYSTLY